MKLKGSLLAIFLLLAPAICTGSGFRVLDCSYEKKSRFFKVTVIMDGQFLRDVLEKLSEGAEYRFYLEFKCKKGHPIIGYILSYDPVTKLYTVENEEKTRFKRRDFFLQNIKRLTVALNTPPSKVRVKRVDPYMPFPFSLIPGLGFYHTDWIACHEKR